jgi:hypothetical protein
LIVEEGALADAAEPSARGVTAVWDFSSLVSWLFQARDSRRTSQLSSREKVLGVTILLAFIALVLFTVFHLYWHAGVARS